MKKIFSVLLILAVVFFTASGYIKRDRHMNVQLYYVDSSMLRLIPTDYIIDTANKEKAAKTVISELIRGRDDNTKILRIIPEVANGLSVKVKGTTAYVNMTQDFVDLHSDSRLHEQLTIYQIVNSLTSIDGIVTVKFTIDNKPQKDFKGFVDMRETFIPDYYI